MTRKNILKKIVTGMFAVGLFMSAYPFVASLSLSDKAKHDSIVTIQIPQLIPGVINEILVNGIPLIVVKPDEKQTQHLGVLDSHVWDKSFTSFNKELGAHIYWGLSSRRGCLLSHKPEGKSNITEWSEDNVWYGGFWDYSCEVSYDYAGRAMKTYSYTFNGFTGQFENLSTPSIFRKGSNGYVVSIYQR